MGGTLVTDDPGKRARVYSRKSHDPAGLHPAVEAGLAAPVCRIGREIAENRTSRRPWRVRAGRIITQQLDILTIDPDVSDVGEGKGEDLAHVGWVSQNLLITRHGRVEDHFTQRRAMGPDTDSLQNGTVG